MEQHFVDKRTQDNGLRSANGYAVGSAICAILALVVELHAAIQWIPAIHICAEKYGGVGESGPCSGPALMLFLLAPLGIGWAALSLALSIVALNQLHRSRGKSRAIQIAFAFSVITFMLLILTIVEFILAVQ